jgi:hypothetical protein
MDPPDIPAPKDPFLPDYVLVLPQVAEPMMLGPIPIGMFDPIGEFVFLQQSLYNNQAMNEMILQRMTQIYVAMG